MKVIRKYVEWNKRSGIKFTELVRREVSWMDSVSCLFSASGAFGVLVAFGPLLVFNFLRFWVGLLLRMTPQSFHLTLHKSKQRIKM